MQWVIIYRFDCSDNTPYEKVGNNDPVSIADEVPFEIPESWEWCRLSDLTVKDIKRGKSPTYNAIGSTLVFAQKCNVKSGGIDMSLAKFLDEKVIGKYPEEEFMRDCDIVVNSTGTGTMGRIGLFHDSDNPTGLPIVPDSHVTIVRPNQALSVAYLMCCLQYYQPYLEEHGEGSTNQKELKPDTIKNLFIPLPPESEQQRIADIVGSLEPYISEYRRKDSQLSDLNKDFPNQLKKSILQLAVQGKLVPQDPNDEPAYVLLERIRAEKERLIAEGKIKRDKNESVIYRRDNSHYEKFGSKEYCIDDELPFEIPDSWMWSKLNMCLDVRDGTHDTPRYVSEGVPLVTSKNLVDGKIDFSTAKNISYADHKEISIRSEVNSGDILFAMIGSIGNPVLYLGEDEFSIKNMALFKHINCGMNMKYVYWYLYLEQYQMRRYSSGGVQAFVSLKYLRNYWIPIPPLEEQERIVSAIENLVEMTCQL